jgi:N-acyl-phosphatidylethanolamine-hydrolysing phospholipase D
MAQKGHKIPADQNQREPRTIHSRCSSTVQLSKKIHVRQFNCRTAGGRVTRWTRTSSLAGLIVALLGCFGCNPLVARFASRAIDQLGDPTQAVVHTVAQPIRSETGLSLLWVGHATVLIQIHDKVIVTDPVFTETVGLLAKRSIEPGISTAAISRLNAILISHIHMDHLSYSSLDLLPKSARLFIPSGGTEYMPEFGFSELRPMKPWQVFEEDGLRITAVPEQHFGGRYGFDAGWSSEPTWTGYVIEYKGTTVFFAGDTGYNPEFFKEIGRRFHIDVALLPIAPVEPRAYMSRIHADPKEALQIFDDLGARLMIPIHHDTFFQGMEPSPAYAMSILKKLIEERGLHDRVRLLEIGEQVILKD